MNTWLIFLLPYHNLQIIIKTHCVLQSVLPFCISACVRVAEKLGLCAQGTMFPFRPGVGGPLLHMPPKSPLHWAAPRPSLSPLRLILTSSLRGDTPFLFLGCNVHWLLESFLLHVFMSVAASVWMWLSGEPVRLTSAFPQWYHDLTA